MLVDRLVGDVQRRGDPFHAFAFRQHDQDFIDILNNLRNNTVTNHDIETLNQHYKTEEEINQLKEIITLTTHNYKADELNQKELRNLDRPSHLFDAHLEGDFPESMYPVMSQLELKEGSLRADL